MSEPNFQHLYNDAIYQRDEARLERDRLRAENDELRKILRGAGCDCEAAFSGYADTKHNDLCTTVLALEAITKYPRTTDGGGSADE